LERQLKGVELSCRLGFEQAIIITVVMPPVKLAPQQTLQKSRKTLF